MTDVGTNKVFENDKIILWEFFLEPGEETPCHTHDKSFISYVIDGSTILVKDANGSQVDQVDVPDGDVLEFQLADGELTVPNTPIRVPATHSATNVGKTAYREMFVEFKS